MIRHIAIFFSGVVGEFSEYWHNLWSGDEFAFAFTFAVISMFITPFVIHGHLEADSSVSTFLVIGAYVFVTVVTAICVGVSSLMFRMLLDGFVDRLKSIYQRGVRRREGTELKTRSKNWSVK